MVDVMCASSVREYGVKDVLDRILRFRQSFLGRIDTRPASHEPEREGDGHECSWTWRVNDSTEDLRHKFLTC